VVCRSAGELAPLPPTRADRRPCPGANPGGRRLEGRCDAPAADPAAVDVAAAAAAATAAAADTEESYG